MKKNQPLPDTSFTLPQATPTCYHCGQDCDEGVILHEEKPFCCQGCQTVYQIISQHDLEGFYHIEAAPAGVSQKGKTRTRFEFLDDLEIAQQLFDFYDGRIAKVRLHLPQIHCTSCLWLLEKMPVIHEGIVQTRVHYMRKEIAVSFYTEQISLRQIVELLTDLGYEPPIRLKDLEDRKEPDRRSRLQKQFLYQVGITGFCFGNIMLLSFPEYLGISDVEKNWQQFFGWLNWALSLPVLLYGASTYWRSAYQAIKHGGLNIDVPIALGIIAIFGQSSYEIFSGTGAGYLDSMSALVFFLLVGKWFQQKTFDNISFERDYKSYFPLAATCQNPDGTLQSRPLSKLDKGEVILVRSGELIPADSELMEGDARIDYSFVTGEAEPVKVAVGETIFAGGRQRGATLTLRLQKPVSQSYLTQLWNDDAFQKTTATDLNLENFTNRVGQRFTAVVLTVAALTGAYWWLHATPAIAISNMAAVLIIACPCALALNVPFALGNAMRILARHRFYAKSTEVLEQMAKLTHLVFDKTGTLTHTRAAVRWVGAPMAAEAATALHALTAQSTHPVSQQIHQFLPSVKQKITLLEFDEIVGKGIQATLDGKVYRLGQAEFVGAEMNPSENFQTTAFVAVDGMPMGYFVLEQSVRSGIRPLMERLRTRFVCALLSGDRSQERAVFEDLLGAEAALHFNQKPADKLAYIKDIQQREAKVMMLGDGLNDAGALQQSDVGVAITDEISQFSPACDAILHSSRLPDLDRFLAFSRQSMRVVYVGFGISLAYNLIGLSFAVQGYLQPVVAAILMPISSITVVLTGMLLTSWYGRKL
ncbi:MAG: heavy metal translocating P-type ATPase [Bernardetiaceae bacterium]